MHNKVWNEIPYPFSNFKGAAVEVWGKMRFLMQHFMVDAVTYPC